MTQWAKTRLSRVLSNGEYGAADTACIGALALETIVRASTTHPGAVVRLR